MGNKTALQEFLEQIVLKQKQGSVYLVPAITDVQIKEALQKEREQHSRTWDNAIYGQSLIDFKEYKIK